MLLSIVVPCYNEESTLKELYRVVKSEIDKIKYFSAYELIFVDDGSKDATLDIIKDLKKEDNLVRFVSFSRNFGKEAGIYAGLKASKGDIVVLMDADLQHPPSLLGQMSEKILVERSEEHTSELQSRQYLVCRLLLEKKKN